MHRDQFDLEVTCSSDAAMQAYLSGIEFSLRFDRSGIDEFSLAIAEDEEFALAHAALGRQLTTHGRRTESVAHLEMALSLSDKATRREQNAIAVVAAAAKANPQAIAMAQAHIAAWPQDILVLTHLLGPFGLLAFSGSKNWAAQNVALLDATESSYSPDSWWRLATRGFFEAEQGQISQAQDTCERAWSISENGNCAHSLVHLHFEAGAIDEGRAFIEAWLTENGSQSDWRHHLAWHLAFLDLESGFDSSRVFEWYGREMDPRINDPTPLETLSDNASLLWRCYLAGEKIPTNVCADLSRYANANFPIAGFPFADAHRAIAAALHPDDSKIRELLRQQREFADDAGSRAAECTYEFARGLDAFANERYDDVVSILEPVLPDSVLLGGSNPQRRLVEDTYLEACMRCERLEQARVVLLNRNRETSVFDRRLLDSIGERFNAL